MPFEHVNRFHPTIESAFSALPPQLRGHCERVSVYTELLLRKAYEENLYPQHPMLTPSRIALAGYAARYHDIGVARIRSDAALKQRGAFRMHPCLGAELICGAVPSEIPGRPGQSFLWQAAALIAQQHHERWNGQGYPNKLCGEEIDLYARACGIADVYDTYTTLYTPSALCCHQAVFEKLVRCPAFDPVLLKALACCEEQFRCASELYQRLK